MNRRSLGRGRIVAAIGSLVVLAGCLFPWGQTAGVGLPPVQTGAFDGFGIVVFVVAVAMLALIVLPYAAGDQPVALDRPVFFGLVAAVGIAGYLLKLLQIAQMGLLLLPDHALGLWLAGIGMAITVWGVGILVTQTPQH